MALTKVGRRSGRCGLNLQLGRGVPVLGKANKQRFASWFGGVCVDDHLVFQGRGRTGWRQRAYRTLHRKRVDNGFFGQLRHSNY